MKNSIGYLKTITVVLFAGCAPYNPPPPVVVDPLCLSKASETDRVKRAALEARCPGGNIATTQAGDLLDESAVALELSINVKSEQDHRANVAGFGTLIPQERQTRAFKMERSDSGKLSILKSEFKGSCTDSQKPRLRYSFYENGKLVRESGSPLAGLATEANKKYSLRISAESQAECRNSSVTVVVGYETDGVQESVQAQGTAIGPRAAGAERKNNQFKSVCLIEKSSQSLNGYIEAEVSVSPSLEVFLSDSKSKVPFVSKNLICGFDIGGPDAECNYESVGDSGGVQVPSQVGWSCQKSKLENEKRSVEWTRSLVLKSFANGSMTLKCEATTSDESLFLDLNNCKRVRKK